MQLYTYNLDHKFDLVLKSHAERIAIMYPEGPSYKYADLDKMANGFASFLLSNGISINDVIAIFNDKSVESFAMMIACLKIGAIYTNLDPNSPEERLNKIIKRCNPKLIFVDPKLKISLDTIDFPAPNILPLGNISGNNEKPDTPYEITGSTPAYIMFTSGSTGFPKGAVMNHSNVLNLIDWANKTAILIHYLCNLYTAEFRHF